MSAPPKAMVLAAGEGRRLRPLTLRIAKPALPFVGVPILSRTLDGLADAGVEEAFVNLHQAPESVRRVVARRGARAPRVSFSDETARLLDTAGALMPVAGRLRGGDFFLVNGDCVHAVDCAALLEAHRASGADATLAVRRTGVAGFGSLLVDADGSVTAFGAPTEGRPEERHFLSVMALSPRLLEFLPPGPPRPWRTFGDWFPHAAEAGCAFRVHETDAEWHAADSPGRYLEATRAWLAARRAGPWIAETARVAADAELDAGCAVHADAVVEGGARLSSSVLLEGARVGAGADLERCLLGPDAVVAAGELLEGRLVVAPGWEEQSA
jgi:mannose-1-phosphate guanylyltransferase